MRKDKPDTRPFLPEALKGVAIVRGSDDARYTVDFNTMVCDCYHGAAWVIRKNSEQWEPNTFCVHKLKALGSLIQKNDNDELKQLYFNELSRRYNAFVLVSAFHKELRRGDKKAAMYWAHLLIKHRGLHNIIAYMRNIVFEETRDYNLYRFLIKLSSHGKSVSLLDTQTAIKMFCESPKKWELPWRMEIFLDEQKAYKKLAKEFTYEVAKGKDVIPSLAVPALKNALFEGFKSKDRVLVQYGLKGFYKAQNEYGISTGHDRHKIDLFNILVDVLNDNVSRFDYDKTYTKKLQRLILNKINLSGNVGYHELNALCDSLCGEPRGDFPPATLPKARLKVLRANKNVYMPPFGEIKNIPRYAHDNHTWEGKAKMKAYGDTELQPSAIQRNIDFRLCGAYMGVAWRLLAYAQHGTIDCKWHDVSWKSPNWLWKHTRQMFY